MARKNYPENRLHPRYWPTWFSIGALKLAAWLPGFIQRPLGRGLGLAALYLAPRRRHITEVNLRLAFPEKSPAEQKKLVRAVFVANGLGLMEAATGLVRDVRFMQERVHFKGREHLEQALAQGKGALILGIHFSVLDLGGALHGLYYSVDAIYKPHKNPVFDRFILKGRQKNFNRLIPHHDLKGLVRRIRQGQAAWYSPDQDFGRKVSVFAPFFGIEAASITMTARIARMTGAPVLPLRVHRNPDHSYTLEYLPPLQGFPCGDEVADATQVNQVIEQLIRIHPEQYLWMHRRFKTRPDPEAPGFY